MEPQCEGRAHNEGNPFPEALLSVVVPCYNEADSLPFFADEFARVVGEMRKRHNLSFELVLVDDGSSDATLDVIKELAKRDEGFSVSWISFSRNFGKEAALYAGLKRARGFYVATMDADMQDPPSLLPLMYELLVEKDCDNVAARRDSRKGEPPIRSFFSRLFYRLMHKMSKVDIPDGARDFRLMKRPMVNAVLSMGERNRFSKGVFGWVGFKTEWLSYDNAERVAGKTKWSFLSLLAYSIEGMVAFSTVPLSIASVAGVVMFVLAVLWGVYIVVKTLLFGDPVAGWPSLACAILFVGGIQLLCLGIMGQYLAKVYLEVKDRPLYVVREVSDEQGLR
ncbi:MAG: glycosyltransferase family 2 protein [Eggerthellaceae bacterium]|nr:glycosyltransferase family 2 protein [Eggerthellaceae bacterium]